MPFRFKQTGGSMGQGWKWGMEYFLENDKVLKRMEITFSRADFILQDP
jgi:hypothetical protein